MYIKGFLTLLSLLFICHCKGQIKERKGEIIQIGYLKMEAYKSIILSREFKSTKKCHIVGIDTNSLKMDYLIGSPIGNYFYNIQEVKDSISVEKLRKELPKQYWIFENPDKFFGIEFDTAYISYLKTSDSLYIPQNIDFEPSVCQNSLDILKIFEPLDKWMGFYTKHYSWDYRRLEVVIPVKYELLDHNFSLEKEKYYLFKIKMGYNNKGKLEIFKEIISGIKEEKDIM